MKMSAVCKELGGLLCIATVVTKLSERDQVTHKVVSKRRQ